MPAGRPTLYTPELVSSEIPLARGLSLEEMQKDLEEDWPDIWADVWRGLLESMENPNNG